MMAIPPQPYFMYGEAKHVPHMRKTKIVATLGPASWGRIKELIEAGVNVFRINFSHADHVHTAEVIENIRKSAAELGVHVAILGDLCGPKGRVGMVENNGSILLEDGKTVLLRHSLEDTKPGVICTPIPEVVRGLAPGHRILLDDGKMRLKVLRRISEEELECEIAVGGELKSKKGINVPDIQLGIPALTEKDKVDAKFILEQKLDFIALSFVQQAQDVNDLRDFIRENATVDHIRKAPDSDMPSSSTAAALVDVGPRIIAKIEKPQALDHLDEIIEAVDGIMVARGDLGVEVDLPQVPLAQKIIISRTKARGKPVITATQMLESMIDNPVPTRAEVSDVASAVYDGTDAVMLSGESASGKHPIEAVTMMSRVCIAAERDLSFQLKVPEDRPWANQNNRAIADAAVVMAHRANTPIMVYTESGNMVFRISQRKPPKRVIAITHEARIARRLALYWGVYSVIIGPSQSSDQVIEEAERAIEKECWLHDREPVLFVSGNHSTLPGLNCTLRLTEFGAAMRAAKARHEWAEVRKHIIHSPKA